MGASSSVNSMAFRAFPSSTKLKITEKETMLLDANSAISYHQINVVLYDHGLDELNETQWMSVWITTASYNTKEQSIKS